MSVSAETAWPDADRSMAGGAVSISWTRARSSASASGSSSSSSAHRPARAVRIISESAPAALESCSRVSASQRSASLACLASPRPSSLANPCSAVSQPSVAAASTTNWPATAASVSRLAPNISDIPLHLPLGEQVKSAGLAIISARTVVSCTPGIPEARSRPAGGAAATCLPGPFLGPECLVYPRSGGYVEVRGISAVNRAEPDIPHKALTVDPTIILPAVGTREPNAVKPRVHSTTDDPVVVGDIPASRLGLQPRPALLARLNRASQGTPVVLTGARGAGKTQLAAMYARAKLADSWRLIAWVNARSSETLLAGLTAVAEAAGLSAGGARPGPADAGQAVRDWLEADGSFRLLVFDDVEDLGLLRPFVPAAGQARVLITAAREPIAELGTNVRVDVFSAEEALALLDGRTGLADEDGAEQQQPSPPGVAEAVLLAMEATSVADRLGVSIAVMELVSMLSPAVVRRDLLHSAGQAGTLVGGGRRVAASMVDQALERLNERSLLGFSLDGQVVSVHRLAARVIRAGLARQGRLVPACRAAASAVEGSVALAKHPDHAAVMEMLGQVAALAENAGTAADDPGEELAAMLTRLRSLGLNYLVELGD